MASLMFSSQDIYLPHVYDQIILYLYNILLQYFQIFCLQHRSYTTHQCPNANHKDVTVLICPLCAKGVRLIPNEDPNITWDVHVNTECDPSNYQTVTKKKRCPVPGCKELLTFSNKIRCRDCTQEHCLKHRFGPDHKCSGPTKPAGFPFMGLLKNSPKGISGEGSSWWGSSLMSAASTARATAETSLQRLSTVTNQALQKARDGMGQGNGGGLSEHCLQCPAKFSSVNALIEHVEKVHEKARPLQRVTVDVCPKCSRAFKDPVLLVEHVERDHRGSSRA